MLRFPIVKILIIIIFLISNFINAQNLIYVEDLKSNFVKSVNKKKYYSNLIGEIYSTFENEPLSNLKLWIKALRDAQSIYLKNDAIHSTLMKSLSKTPDKYLKLQRTSLEVTYPLYHSGFENVISEILKTSKDKISVAISIKYLLRAKHQGKKKSFYRKIITIRFPKYKNYPLLNSLYNDLSVNDENKFSALPSITDLIKHNFQKGKTIIYSFHRKNRQYPGISIIKKPNGKFVTNDDGSLFSIPQLAISYSNLPGYIPNGNTPEGIFSIVGWYISPTKTIGPTPNILVRSPFEVQTEIFYHGKNKSSKWNYGEYKNLLPNSWKNYKPIYQSYYAGKIGRKLIIMHGSTDELEFYKDLPYYPLTPTRGCLSAKEIWSGTGKCIESDQVKLINAFRSTKQKQGFLVVIEIDDKQKAIEINDIIKFIDE